MEQIRRILDQIENLRVFKHLESMGIDLDKIKNENTEEIICIIREGHFEDVQLNFETNTDWDILITIDDRTIEIYSKIDRENVSDDLIDNIINSFPGGESDRNGRLPWARWDTKNLV